MYVLVGANGYLGSYVMRAILRQTHEQIIATARKIDDLHDSNRVSWRQCDIQREEDVARLTEELREQSDVKIVYLAAYHHPDQVAQNPEYAWNVNVTCLSRFVNSVRFAKTLFYASTDSVYGNSVDGYRFREDDSLHPVNIYGHNKCAAEAVVVHAGFHVARFPFLISPSICKKKHFYDVIADSIRAGIPFEMFSDSYRSSLSFENAARLLVSVMELEGNVPDILNICGDAALSKYDVGLMVADQCGVDRKLIVPVSIRKKQENFETERAVSVLMDNSRIKQLLHLSAIDIFDEPQTEVNI